MEIAIRPMR